LVRTSASEFTIHVPEGVELISIDINMSIAEGATSGMAVYVKHYGTRTFNQNMDYTDVVIADVKAYTIGSQGTNDFITTGVKWSQTIIEANLIKIWTDTYATFYTAGGEYASVIKMIF
jgi:hypothetical protein